MQGDDLLSQDFFSSARTFYKKAFERVSTGHFAEAASFFERAAKKFRDAQMAERARANGLLYQYLASGDGAELEALVHQLASVPELEVLGSFPLRPGPTEMLRTELEGRQCEYMISQVAKDDFVQLHKAHESARDAFRALMKAPLQTYRYVKADDEHTENAEMRFHYHAALVQFYDAMLMKDDDPTKAAQFILQAKRSFQACKDQQWVGRMEKLRKDWRETRVCWLCHREVQGRGLHFSLCQATVTPYIEKLLVTHEQDQTTVDRTGQQIVLCTPCESLIVFKAKAAADLVCGELTARLDRACADIRDLQERLYKKG
jgi:hypothetical protein